MTSSGLQGLVAQGVLPFGDNLDNWRMYRGMECGLRGIKVGAATNWCSQGCFRGHISSASVHPLATTGTGHRGQWSGVLEAPGQWRHGARALPRWVPQPYGSRRDEGDGWRRIQVAEEVHETALGVEDEKEPAETDEEVAVPIISRHTHALGPNLPLDPRFGLAKAQAFLSAWRKTHARGNPMAGRRAFFGRTMAARHSLPEISAVPVRNLQGSDFAGLPHLPRVRYQKHKYASFSFLGLSHQESMVAICAGAVITLAVVNRILFKMALISMKAHPLFLAQVLPIGYTAVYASIVALRRRAGLVTDAMLSLPKGGFMAIGALEALGSIVGLIAAARVPGALLPVLAQGYLIWQLVLSSLILGRRYSAGQLSGVMVLLAGIFIVVTSGRAPTSGFGGASSTMSTLYLASYAFTAAASIIKEMTFRDSAAKLKGRGMDVFVVNMLGSAFQATVMAGLLPLAFLLRGIPLHEVPSRLFNGAGCLLNADGCSSCVAAPWIPILYMFSNLAFNVAQVVLIKMSTAVIPSLALTLAVPLSVATFTLPLPMLGHPAALPPSFLSGTCIILAGLLIFFMQASHAKSKPRILQPHFTRVAGVASSAVSYG